MAFTFFLVVSVRALHRNYRDGEPRLKQINTFLLANFISQIVLFVFVFGAFNSHRCLAELLQVVLVAVKPINFPLCSGATFLPKVSDLLVNFLY